MHFESCYIIIYEWENYNRCEIMHNSKVDYLFRLLAANSTRHQFAGVGNTHMLDNSSRIPTRTFLTQYLWINYLLDT